MTHPNAGGRYFRNKDGSLTRAEDGDEPKAAVAAEAKAAPEPQPAGAAIKRDITKGKHNG